MQAWYCRPALNWFPLNPGGEDVTTLFLFFSIVCYTCHMVFSPVYSNMSNLISCRLEMSLHIKEYVLFLSISGWLFVGSEYVYHCQQMSNL